MLSQHIVDSLFPPDLPEPEHWERRYPPRHLPEGAAVTRFAPSPTGFLHIGGVYTAMICADLARHSGGVYLVRIEDTDQTRLVEGAAEQFAEAFAYFDISPTEDELTGRYGPYTQSARQEIYLTYVRELMRQDKAYPCFATKEELISIAERQKAVGALPGYYGQWAIWRNATPEEVMARLDAGEPYVVRFRSPGVAGVRVTFTDLIRGELTQDDNRNDAVILKSTEPRLPPYALAHVVDDHLMRINPVVRAEEWLSSVPLHHQLFDALGFERIPYAHVAPLMKQVGSSRRKLSKRHDPESSVGYYIAQGYPAEAVQYYLRGLANGRLAELPLAQALATPIRLADFGTAGPLIDIVKLDDISADYIAALTGEEIVDRYVTWADSYDAELATVVSAQLPLALRALAIERVDTPNPRKDLRKWSDFRVVYGYFFPEIFEPVADPADSRFGGLAADLVKSVASEFADGYQEPGPDVDWFGQIRDLAARLGFAPNQKAYKQDPSAYPGSIREASQVIRVLLTGTPRSAELSQVAGALGRDEVLRRVRAVLLQPCSYSRALNGIV
jgi:glutamyl-tRNA synthetase